MAQQSAWLDDKRDLIQIDQIDSQNFKRRVYEILEVAKSNDRLSRSVDVFIVCLIALNVLALVAETVDWIHGLAPKAFILLEILSVAIFSVEYVLRVWACTVNPKYQHPVLGRLRFTLTPMAIVDLLAVLPFYLTMLYLDLRFLRSLRLLRLLRLAKLGRYLLALQTFKRVISSKKEEVLVTVSLMALLLLLVKTIASSLMYFAENDVQPIRPPEAFPSIPAAMWWGVATVTTVGYGDVYPVTSLGKLLGAIVAVLGIATFALPTAVLAPGFLEEMENRKKKKPTEKSVLTAKENSDPGQENRSKFRLLTGWECGL